MSLGPLYHHLNGYYDANGTWNRTKYCLVSCGNRCDCGPPGGLYYSAVHDKNKIIKPQKTPDDLLREAVERNKQ